jgi:hypothetical protein
VFKKTENLKSILEKIKKKFLSSFQSVYLTVYEGMLLFFSVVLFLRCDLLDEQLKIWRKEEDEILCALLRFPGKKKMKYCCLELCFD